MAKSQVVMLASSSAWLNLTIEADSLDEALAKFRALTPDQIHSKGWMCTGESIDRVVEVTGANGQCEEHPYPTTINRFHLDL